MCFPGPVFSRPSFVLHTHTNIHTHLKARGCGQLGFTCVMTSGGFLKLMIPGSRDTSKLPCLCLCLTSRKSVHLLLTAWHTFLISICIRHCIRQSNCKLMLLLLLLVVSEFLLAFISLCCKALYYLLFWFFCSCLNDDATTERTFLKSQVTWPLENPEDLRYFLWSIIVLTSCENNPGIVAWIFSWKSFRIFSGVHPQSNGTFMFQRLQNNINMLSF